MVSTRPVNIAAVTDRVWNICQWELTDRLQQWKTYTPRHKILKKEDLRCLGGEAKVRSARDLVVMSCTNRAAYS